MQLYLYPKYNYILYFYIIQIFPARKSKHNHTIIFIFKMNYVPYFYIYANKKLNIIIQLYLYQNIIVYYTFIYVSPKYFD
jgi:hypothetical protein